MVVACAADRCLERIAHMAYLDEAVAGNGQAVIDSYPPAVRAIWQAVVGTERDGWRLLPDDPSGFGITISEDVAWVHAGLAPQPFKTITQPRELDNPDGFAGPTTFIACVAAGPAAWRDAMVGRALAEPGWLPGTGDRTRCDYHHPA
jgi:hypothetical protein